MNQPDIQSGFRRLLDALNGLHIEYMVVGSLASSIHGASRATMDIDIVAAIRKEKVPALVESLKADFYADAEEMEHAVAAGRAFNLIHYPSGYKFDLFPLAADRFSQSEFSRRKTATLPACGPEETLRFPVATEEDTILGKLLWYKLGGESSERQWNDVLGVARIRGPQLDIHYMRQWAADLGVDGLLARLLEQARS